jgi:hypothetical protein
VKAAFDAHIPAALVRIFQSLQNERKFKIVNQGITVESALTYTPKIGDHDYARKSDSPWIRRFAKDGGKIILSGDMNMLKRPHERLALIEEKMIVVFFSGGWDNLRFFQKSAFVLNWWPVIADTAKKAEPATFWRVPSKWDAGLPLMSVPTDDLRLIKLNKQLAAKENVAAARKAKRARQQDGEKNLLDLMGADRER